LKLKIEDLNEQLQTATNLVGELQTEVGDYQSRTDELSYTNAQLQSQLASASSQEARLPEVSNDDAAHKETIANLEHENWQLRQENEQNQLNL
jgi:predicted  nucleic acid-binding Zn-ribbon protein